MRPHSKPQSRPFAPRFAAGLVLAASLVACGGSGDGAEAQAELAFTVIETSLYSAVGAAETHAVSTPTAFSALWARHIHGVSSAPPQPAVDFATHQVLAVFLGPQSDGCRRVTVTRVTQTASARIARYQRHTPGPTETCAAVIITPAQMVRVSASSLPVQFVQE